MGLQRPYLKSVLTKSHDDAWFLYLFKEVGE